MTFCFAGLEAYRADVACHRPTRSGANDHSWLLPVDDAAPPKKLTAPFSIRKLSHWSAPSVFGWYASFGLMINSNVSP